MNKINNDAAKRNVRSYRIKAGLTQNEAAKQMKVSRSTFIRWEQKPAKMTFENKEKMAVLYNCTVDDFFTEA